jgi:hypothetical protein
MQGLCFLSTTSTPRMKSHLEHGISFHGIWLLGSLQHTREEEKLRHLGTSNVNGQFQSKEVMLLTDINFLKYRRHFTCIAQGHRMSQKATCSNNPSAMKPKQH